MQVRSTGLFTLIDSRNGCLRTSVGIGSLAAALEELIGPNNGESVAISIEDKFDFVTMLLAASQLDIRIVPLDPFAPAIARAAFIAASGANIVIGDQHAEIDPNVVRFIPGELVFAAERVGAFQATFSAMKSNWLYFTSGSTGTPKGVEFSSEMVRSNVGLALDALPYAIGYRTASLLPAYHTFTLISDIMTAFALDGSCVVMPDFEIAQLDHTFQSLTEYRVQTFSGVPIIFDVLAAFSDRLRRTKLRFVTSGAAPLRGELVDRYARSAAHPLVPCYGMTEGVCFLSISDPSNVKPGSAGLPRVELRIADDCDRPTSPLSIGSIQVRGYSVIKGGYFNALATSDTDYAEGGWLRTGDLGYLDEEGVLFITGRCKNLVIRGGKKVYLEDLEALFDVGTVAAIPQGGENRERFVFFYEEGRYDERSVFELISGRLGGDHLPDRIIPIAHVPRSPTGKLRRQVLEEGLQRGSY